MQREFKTKLYINDEYYRMLGGTSLGIDLNTPKVIARIFPEKDAKLKLALEVCYFVKCIMSYHEFNKCQ